MLLFTTTKMIGRGGTIARPTGPSAVALWRLINTSSTAYPSGSVRHPTQIMTPSVSTKESANRWQKSRTVPASHRSLPELPSRTPLYVGSFLVIGSIWAGFIWFSTNAEKASSSIVKAVLFELRSHPIVIASLGHSIKPEKDDLFGQLWVDGQINLMQGSVDVAFRICGSEGSGKVYFTSVRRDRGSEFEILRWKLIRDDGMILDLLNEEAQDRPVVMMTDGDTDDVAIGSLRARRNSATSAPPEPSHSPAIRLV